MKGEGSRTEDLLSILLSRFYSYKLEADVTRSASNFAFFFDFSVPLG